MKDIKTIFSTNLRNKLIAKNKTQAELARFVGVSQTSVSHWCNGEVLPRANMVDKIAKFLVCSSDELMIDNEKEAEQAPEDIIAEEIRDNPRLFKLMIYASKLSNEELDEIIARIKK